MVVDAALRRAGRAIGEPLISAKESKRLTAYLDTTGTPTIGRGFVEGVHLGMQITLAQEAQWFDEEYAAKELGVIAVLTRTPTAHQLGALMSLAWNIGVDAFQGSSVVRLFNQGNDKGAAKAFELWRKETVTEPVTKKKIKRDNAGLLTRRKEEAAIFLTPDNAATPVVTEVPDALYAPPQVPGVVPQQVEAASPAGSFEKIGTAVIGAGGLGTAGSVVEKAADKDWRTLAVLLGFVALMAVLGFLWWRYRMRRG